MNPGFSFSTSRSSLSFAEVVQLSNMASYGLPTNLLFCKLCQKIYKEPKLLPCLHTYCQECLEKQTQETNRVTCSLCGYSMISPPEGVAGLTTNIFAERVVKQYIEKIQEFAKTDEVTGNLSNRNSVTDTELYDSLVERAKYSPNSLSLFSIQKRDNSNINSSDINMESVENGGNASPQISHQPDLVQSHTSSADSRHNMVMKLSNHMDHKLMALQGEALRVTYAIDSINQTINEWRENRYQLKRKVEERSNMLQHQIRRHEKRLMAEIDNRYHEDKMMKDADTSKLVLRQNLKGILQTVEFLKQVQDFATDDEMINLKDRLMSCSVNISEVKIKWHELVMEIPEDSPEHLMVTDFGKLSKSEKSSVVFLPGSLEMEQDMKEDENAFNDSFLNDQIFSYTRSPPINRRLRNRSSRVSETEIEIDGNMSDTSSVTVNQFRTMRESFKQRRRQLLEETGEFGAMKEENFPILHDPLVRLNSSKRKNIRSFAGTLALPHDNPHFLDDSQLNLEQVCPLPANASSRDITDRNVISEQMAHLSNEQREDKIKRMQELRQSWKRRKEFLMKNDGYISPSADAAAVFDYEEKVQEMIDDTPSSGKQSRIKQLRNRLSMIRQHFQPDAPKNSTEIEDKENLAEISTANVVRRNKPKEKKEKRWSGIFRIKDKRKSLSSRDSKEFVLDDFDTQTLDGDEIKQTESSAPRTNGLTRTKLQQMRESVRKKTQRWRTINSA